jgi:serine/threonine protein kinase
VPLLSALAEESARARDHTGPIALDYGGGGSNMLAPLTRWQRVPLSSGARLGPYDIVAPLGSGGMGVVYRAYDSRLNRVVAIKVLGPLPHAA